MFKSLKLYKNFGFTLIELMIVIAIIGTLAGLAVPSYINYIERTKMLRVISEIRLIEKELFAYQMEHNTLPDNLDEIGLGNLRDPWNNPYEYLPVAGTPKGKLRKDHFMVPVNTDFDLYSKGQDGKSRSPFTAKASRDDIVRANNGQYVGSVAGYN
ncbi:MAG: prepilin-type N-terminal cleavage/methylation domain-containing protein [Desulfobacula sp.]|uniref:prepilin-type N-terminal cleavage/methylation domain-containing protein n=1 Tax=Desulfobacula sp. TaxID=2593537 RepID=UPI0025B89F8C|nr:prepilin-type N-terminal cleavage/methylation domain-containing protein [Desulfobacula sp.]MCD4720299.1 prepilin-type N-terminal cleavage/methylation domain-containing protein [Desulfobacula sp.]